MVRLRIFMYVVVIFFSLTAVLLSQPKATKYIGYHIRKQALQGASFFDYRKLTASRCQESDNCAKIEADCGMDCKGEKGNVSQESARRYGSGIFKGCFQRPDNVTLALPTATVIDNMSVDKCVACCTGKEFTLAALSGERCLCGFPTARFTLHEHEDEELCHRLCPGEELQSCGTEDYFLVYQTQVQDNRCMDRRFMPARSKHLVALASFPGSGNTWARHLIELATGFYTGSYYFDRSLYYKGFKGEKDDWRTGRTISIKTHKYGKNEIEAFESAILLIRNPYKALMAEFNRMYGSHTGFASQVHWKGKEWPVFVNHYAPVWAWHVLNWLRYSKQVQVVHYEELMADLFAQLKGMVHFLGLKASGDRLLCVEGQKDGKFKRSGKLEYDPYTPEMRTAIDRHIRSVDDALRLRKLSRVPEEYRPR